MEIILIVIFALLGVAVGSFLNVCIDRLPALKSPVYPPSRCDICQHPLSPKDLIPVLSYLWLRGRCRYCHEPIPQRSLWVEVGSGLLFAFLFWHHGMTIDFVVIALYCCIFIVVMVIDLEHKLILNRVVYPAAVAALIILAVASLLPGLGLFRDFVFLPKPEILSGIIGGAVGFAFLLIPAVIYSKGMGFGDVKMAGLIGLVTGFPLVAVALILGIVLGGLVAVALLLSKKKQRKEAIAFGPFLAVSTIVTMLWGSEILNWYLGFYSF